MPPPFPPPDTPAPRLQFRGVTVAANPGLDDSLDQVSFDLAAGAIMLVHATPEAADRLLDLANGLQDPDAGAVAVDGQSWRDMPPDRSARLRGETGRMFGDHAWVSNLDVDENIFLRLLHHTRQPRAAVEDQAQKLAAALGLPALPRQRPAWVSPRLLQQAQWVRALMGPPRLCLLDRPERLMNADDLQRGCAALASACAQGTAALWVSDDMPDVISKACPDAKKYRLAGGVLVQEAP